MSVSYIVQPAIEDIYNLVLPQAALLETTLRMLNDGDIFADLDLHASLAELVAPADAVFLKAVKELGVFWGMINEPPPEAASRATSRST